MKSEELATPYKVVRRRGVKDGPGPAPDTSKEVPEEDEIQASSVIPVSDAMVTKMYGRWQTQQWEVPTAVGGVVPKNDRGNVHCPPLASELPKVCYCSCHVASLSIAPVLHLFLCYLLCLCASARRSMVVSSLFFLWQAQTVLCISGNGLLSMQINCPDLWLNVPAK